MRADTIMGAGSQLVTCALYRRWEAMEDMVPVPQDIRKKCSISSLTHVGQRCLTGRQESIFLGFIDYRLQSLLARYINKAPPDRRSVQNTTDQDGIWHIPEGATTQPVGSQHTKRVECLGTAANNFVNVRFEWKAFMNCDSKNHQLIYPLYTWNRRRW